MSDEEEGAEQLHTTLEEQHRLELEKAQHVHAQKSLYDDLLKLRISLQQSHALVNRLPQYDVHAAFEKSNSAKFRQCIESTQSVLDGLFTLQNKVISTAPDLKLPSNSEEEEEEEGGDVWKERIETVYAENRKPILQILDKWNQKTRLASGTNVAQNKQFKAINLDLVSQIEQYLGDETNRPRMINRTRPKRAQIDVIGQDKDTKRPRTGHAQTATETTTGSVMSEYDEEIFDDTDVFRTFLQEHAAEIGAEQSEQSVNQALPQRPKPLKTKEDRLKTKGRQMRYIVYSELVNFMVPEDVSAKRDVPILNRIFGKPVQLPLENEPTIVE